MQCKAKIIARVRLVVDVINEHMKVWGGLKIATLAKSRVQNTCTIHTASIRTSISIILICALRSIITRASRQRALAITYTVLQACVTRRATRDSWVCSIEWATGRRVCGVEGSVLVFPPAGYDGGAHCDRNLNG